MSRPEETLRHDEYRLAWVDTSGCEQGGAPLEDAHEVRRIVFMDEQGVSEEIEMDGKDDEAEHVVAYELTEEDTPERPVGTARLRIPEPGVVKLERIAVLKSHRRNGLGKALVEALEAQARRRGCDRALLHAQTTVEEFYESCGYETVSDVFDEAGIPHVKMETRLDSRRE